MLACWRGLFARGSASALSVLLRRLAGGAGAGPPETRAAGEEGAGEGTQGVP